jgi:hypothetical protein
MMRRVSEEPSAERSVAAVPGNRRPEWIVRGIFEAGMILIGLLGGFALNEWQQSRERRERAAQMLSVIRSELKENLTIMQEVSAYNTAVVERLRALRSKGARAMPPGTLDGPLFAQRALTSAAWMSAQSGGVVTDIPIEAALRLARVYESQQDYSDSASELKYMLYAARLQSAEPGTATIDPQRVTGTLSDFADRGRSLVRQYQASLKVLGESPR